MLELERYGVPFSRTVDGYQRPFGGETIEYGQKMAQRPTGEAPVAARRVGSRRGFCEHRWSRSPSYSRSAPRGGSGGHRYARRRGRAAARGRVRALRRSVPGRRPNLACAARLRSHPHCGGATCRGSWLAGGRRPSARRARGCGAGRHRSTPEIAHAHGVGALANSAIS